MLVQKAQHQCRALLVQREPVAPGMRSGLAKYNQDVLCGVLTMNQRPVKDSGPAGWDTEREAAHLLLHSLASAPPNLIHLSDAI